IDVSSPTIQKKEPSKRKTGDFVKSPTKSTSNNSIILAEKSAVFTDLSSARRTGKSASSASVRTSIDVISSTKTEVTHVESTKFAMDHDITTEVVSMDETIVDKSGVSF
ncbi:unnamed protein product, partial [Hymenolepis diminuta]